jgi:hypothetical protein
MIRRQRRIEMKAEVQVPERFVRIAPALMVLSRVADIDVALLQIEPVIVGGEPAFSRDDVRDFITDLLVIGKDKIRITAQIADLLQQ